MKWSEILLGKNGLWYNWSEWTDPASVVADGRSFLCYYLENTGLGPGSKSHLPKLMDCHKLVDATSESSEKVTTDAFSSLQQKLFAMCLFWLLIKVKLIHQLQFDLSP